MREQITQEQLLPSLRSLQDDRSGVGGELAKNLAAGAARPRHRSVHGKDGDGSNQLRLWIDHSPASRREDRRAFGAHRQTVRCILDVASGDDLSARRPQRRSHRILGVRNVGLCRSGACGLKKLLRSFFFQSWRHEASVALSPRPGKLPRNDTPAVARRPKISATVAPTSANVERMPRSAPGWAPVQTSRGTSSRE